MFISKTPYRVSFFGGGTDYPIWFNKFGGEVISTTIDKYLFLSCRDTGPYFKNFRVIYSKIENTKNINKIKLKVVKEALKLFKIKKGIEIHYNGHIPARTGMGSSSSFAVGLINLLSAYRNVNLSKKLLAQKSINFEHKILRENVGFQDQVAASYGGFNNISFQKNSKFKIQNYDIEKKYFKSLNNNLILVYTGIRRSANQIAKSYLELMINEKKKDMFEIMSHTKEAKKIIENHKIDEFGLLLNETWKLKRGIGKMITNSKIDYIYNEGMKQGAKGGKLLGAGAGGFLLFCIQKEKQNKFLSNLKNISKIKFKFTNEGSKIIYKDTN